MVLPYINMNRLTYWQINNWGLPRWHSSKESTCQCRRRRFNSWVGTIPWSRKRQPTSVFFPGKFCGQRSLVGYSLQVHRVGHNWVTAHTQIMCLLVAQSCPILCNPMDCSPPGSSVHRILQARILEWVVIPFPRGIPEPGIKSESPALQVISFPSEPLGKPQFCHVSCVTI